MCIRLITDMKRLFYYISMIFTVILTVNGCVNVKGLEVTSAKVESVRPRGMRALGLTANIGIDNPSREFSIYDIEGSIYRGKQNIGDFKADPVTVLAKRSMTYMVKAEFSMDSSLTFMDLMAMIPDFDLDEYRTDIQFKVRPKGGCAQKIRLKDIPVRNVMDMFR